MYLELGYVLTHRLTLVTPHLALQERLVFMRRFGQLSQSSQIISFTRGKINESRGGTDLVPRVIFDTSDDLVEGDKEP